MKPVILIERTTPADAYRYTRFAPCRRGTKPESTDIVETPAVEVGRPLSVLEPEDVEWLRSDPKKFFA